MASVSRTEPVDVVQAPGIVVLRGGSSVFLPAVQLAWRLENKGCVLVLEDDALVVRPKRLLTVQDREDIRQWLDELKRIARYCADERAVV
jgi:hypothetical protein